MSDVPTHASGFPAFGPATMCGEGEPSTNPPPIEVTCEKCIDMLTPENLAARLQELTAAGVKIRRHEFGGESRRALDRAHLRLLPGGKSTS